MQWFPSIRGIVVTQGEEAKKVLIDKVTEGLVLLEEVFEKCSKGKAFFGGDGIGFLDIAFGVIEKMNELKLLDEAKTPGVSKRAERFCADGAVKGVMPETLKLIEFAKVVHDKMRETPPQQ
jgi:glutathione S-transferase